MLRNVLASPAIRRLSSGSSGRMNHLQVPKHENTN
jgi:hypothetical protein